jgi:hypothetical protein
MLNLLTSLSPLQGLAVLVFLPTVETVGYYRSSLRDWISWQQFFAMRLVVSVPPAQGFVKRGQQKCRQNSNDGNDHQKFNQREC